MTYKQLYIFVEGEDDKRFINSVVKPLFLQYYAAVIPILYAGQKQQNIVKFIQTFNNQLNTDYIFFCDLDSRGNVLCVTKRKEIEQNKYSNCFENERMIVVKEEIESWYLAGIAETFKMKPFADTERVTKEDFEKLIPKSFINKIDLMIEILKEYNLEEARQRNQSFAYFVKKFKLA